MSTALELPFIIEQPRRLLLAPLRAEVERLEAVGREQLARLAAFNDQQGSILEDTISEAIDPRSTDLVDLITALHARDCCRQAFGRAARGDRREGYDTWPARRITRLCEQLRAMADTLHQLHHARRDIARAEAQEIASLKRATA